MPHDVFISYSSADKLAADAVCHGLEAQGIRCWIAPRDQIAGKPYGEQITAAIHDAKVLVLIFSEHVNQSHAVHNEIDLAAGDNIAIIPFRITGDDFNPELRFYLGRVHWLDAFPLPVNNYIDNLVAMVKRNLPGGEAHVGPPDGSTTPVEPPLPPRPTPAPPPNPTNYTPLLVVGGIALVVIVLAVMINAAVNGPKPANFTVASANTAAPDATSNAAPPPPPVAPPAETPPPAAAQVPPVNPQAVNYYETVMVQGGPPASLDGATLVNTAQLLTFLQARDAKQINFVLVDARGCIGEVSIKTAVCENPNTIETLEQNVALAQPIVVFCLDGTCPESFQFAQAAMAAGYQHVFWYRGGINAWLAAGYLQENLPNYAG
ncbi:MAG: TIR domain-containing protein [Caulobacterales bacterium]